VFSQVVHSIKRIDKALEHEEVDKKVRQKLNYAHGKWPDKLVKYAKQEKQIGDRKSMSKTETSRA
jgi:hypothetical protein